MSGHDKKGKIVSGDDVFVKTKQCCGEVREEKKQDIFLVLRDADSTTGDHHVSDLIKFPLDNVRVEYKSFYFRVDASREGGVRKSNVRCYRGSGRRIW